MAVAIATARRQQLNEDAPPPEYTPRVEAEPEQSVALPYPQGDSSDVEIEETACSSVQPVPISERPNARRVGYAQVQVTDQEVNAFGYQPPAKAQKLQKKRAYQLVFCRLSS
jgi:hypothetical protein